MGHDFKEVSERQLEKLQKGNFIRLKSYATSDSSDAILPLATSFS